MSNFLNEPEKRYVSLW